MCKAVIIISVFILPELSPPPPPKHLMQAFNLVVDVTSYSLLNWTIEDKANITHFVLQVDNSKNISILAEKNTYLFEKGANDTVTIFLGSMDKCGQMSVMEEKLTLRPDNRCKLTTETAFKYYRKCYHM